MFFAYSISSRRGRRGFAAAPLRLGGVALVLAGLGALACGSAAAGGEAEEEAAAECNSDADCVASQACQDAVCVQRVSVTSRDAGRDACSVMSCPAGAGACCSAASASATGNQRQEYTPRLQLLDFARSSVGEVRAKFTFDAPDQQGWVTFQLDGEHDLSELQFTGRHEGVADRFLSVNTNRFDSGGCAYGFELDPMPQPPGSDPPFLLGNEVSFSNANFCYGNGVPGRASELAFAIFSTQPGDAWLIISNITLQAR